MMEETGYNKTFLIKIIVELKNIKIYIFNLHAGIDDKDIIDVINKNKLNIDENEKKRR